MLALFLPSVAHGQAVVDPTAGTQAATSCPEPKMAKLPRKRKIDAAFNVRASGVTNGTQWLLRIDGQDWAAGTAESNAIRHQAKMSDFGLRPRKVNVELVLANEACDNSPWKLTRKVGYAGRYNGKLAPPGTPKQAPAQEQSSSPAPAATAPTPARTPSSGGTGRTSKPVIPKPVNPPAKVRPLQAPTNGRVWVTPSDVTAHSSDRPRNPKLPRAELKTDDAQSTNALVGLGIIFIVIAISTAVGLLLLNRKDVEMDSAAEEGRLPTHLDTTDIGNLALSEAGAAVVKQGPVPSLLAEDATAPVLGEETSEAPAVEPAGEAPTEVIPGHVEPDHIASEPGDVPVPVAGAPRSQGPVPPPAEGLGDDNITSFLEEPQPTADEFSAAEPHPTAASAGALSAAAAAADRDAAANGDAPAADQNEARDSHDQNEGRPSFEELISTMLEDSAVQQELRTIVAEARDDALRQGLPVDRDGIIAELDRVTASAHLSGPAREKLMARFEEIVSDELRREPQAH